MKYYPLPSLPPRGKELLIISPLGEIRKGVSFKTIKEKPNI
jgi:hypothetical protein